MVKAIRASKPGGIDVLSWDEVEVGNPGAGEVRLRHTAIGVNFIDTYHRAGTYPGSTFPAPLGVEGAGVASLRSIQATASPMRWPAAPMPRHAWFLKPPW